MAERKNNLLADSSANLLFSAAPEFNFNLPFIPVSQATGPAVLSGGTLTCYWTFMYTNPGFNMGPLTSRMFV